MVMSISIDKEIKDRAMQKAKTDNLPLSLVIRLLLLDYANGKIKIGSHPVEVEKVEVVEVDDEIQKMMDDIMKKWHKKNKK